MISLLLIPTVLAAEVGEAEVDGETAGLSLRLGS